MKKTRVTMTAVGERKAVDRNSFGTSKKDPFAGLMNQAKKKKSE